MTTKIWQNGQICNFCSEHARDLILVSIPRFSGKGNPLGPFSDTFDWPEWPNRHLWPFMTTKIWQNGQICNFCSEHARDLILVSFPMFLGMGKPLGPFSDTSDWPEWPNRHLWPFMTTKIWLNGQIWFTKNATWFQIIKLLELI